MWSPKLMVHNGKTDTVNIENDGMACSAVWGEAMAMPYHAVGDAMPCRTGQWGG